MIETSVLSQALFISISVKNFNSALILCVYFQLTNILGQHQHSIGLRHDIEHNSCVYRIAVARNPTFGASFAMASVAATIAVVRASATELGGGSTAKKQKREKRPSENRPMAEQKGKAGERSAKVRNGKKTDG